MRDRKIERGREKGWENLREKWDTKEIKKDRETQGGREKERGTERGTERERERERGRDRQTQRKNSSQQ